MEQLGSGLVQGRASLKCQPPSYMMAEICLAPDPLCSPVISGKGNGGIALTPKDGCVDYLRRPRPSQDLNWTARTLSHTMSNKRDGRGISASV